MSLSSTPGLRGTLLLSPLPAAATSSAPYRCCITPPMRPEDLDTGATDHIADEARYACLSRPLTARRQAAPTRAPDRWEQEWGRGTSWKTMDSWKVL